MPSEDKPRDEWLEKFTEENCPRFERKPGVQYFGPAFSEECSEVLRNFISSPGIIDATRYYVAWDPAKLGSERTVFADGLTLRHKEDGTTEVERGPFKPAEPGEEVEWKSADGSTYMVHASTERGAGDYKPVDYHPWFESRLLPPDERRQALIHEMSNWIDPAPEYELDANGKVELDHKGNPVPRRKRKHEDR